MEIKLKSSSIFRWLNSTIDIGAKFIKNIFLIILIFLILKSLIYNLNTPTLIIEPFKVPETLSERGYSGEVLVIQLIDKIHEITRNGSTFSVSNNLIVPSWDNKMELIQGTSNSSWFNETFHILKILVGINPISARGELIQNQDHYNLFFRIDDKEPIIINVSGNMDISKIAEYVAKHFDPYNLAAYYAKKGELANCLELVQKMLTDNDKSNDEYAFFLRGKIFMNIDNGEKIAKEMFRKAIKIGKNRSPSFNNLGIIYEDEDKLDSAKRYYKYAISNNIKYAGAYLNLGNIYKKYSDKCLNNELVKNLYIDSSANEYANAIKYDPTMVYGYASLGSMLFLQNKYKEVDDQFRIAMELEPQNNRLFFAYALLLREKKDTANAIKYLETAYKLDSLGFTGQRARIELDKLK